MAVCLRIPVFSRFNRGMRLLICLLSVLAAHPIFADEYRKLIIIGDSLTEGYGVTHDQAYPHLLQQKIDKLDKKWRVVNSGISGSTAASAPSRVTWILKQKPELILIALGANDGLRGAPVASIEENLAKAVAACKAAGVKTIVVGMKLPPNYGADYTRNFEGAFGRVANKAGVPLLPFLLEGVAGKGNLNQADGIHPNEKGHAIVAETVFKFVKGYL